VENQIELGPEADVVITTSLRIEGSFVEGSKGEAFAVKELGHTRGPSPRRLLRLSLTTSLRSPASRLNKIA
jgi:hypothetical protein